MSKAILMQSLKNHCLDMMLKARKLSPYFGPSDELVPRKKCPN